MMVLDTTGLHGAAFDWRHYGVQLALFGLCRCVRIEIRKDHARTLRRKLFSKARYFADRVGLDH